MKITLQACRSVVALLGVWFLPLGVVGQGLPDLPYSSGSTGADGPLSFRTFLSPGRHQHSMAFDEERKETVVFGGLSHGTPLNDTWSWNGTTWQLETPTQSPTARYDHAMAYDSVRKQVVLYGGIRPGIGEVAETWTWNGTNWTQLSPAQSPPRLSRHAMAYDAERQQVVLFGGYDPTRGNINETWLWDGSNWTKAAPTTVPTGGRSRHGLAYDAERKVVTMYTGEGSSETQVWTWDGANWTPHTSNVQPPFLQDYALAYDALHKQVILFGGYRQNIGGPPVNDTWAWDGTTWGHLVPAVMPTGRVDHTMAYDSVRKKVILAGGYDSSAETWLFDGTTWEFWSADYANYDMTSKADGLWNYTTIDVQAGLTVNFIHNAANTPVRWLASGNVTINGILNLNGENGSGNPNPGNEAKGGPGGYAGGLGAIRFDQSSTYTGTPGQGPGGGAPGVGAADGYNGGLRYAKQGTYNGTYGNAYIQPLLGGSGGGGGGSGYSDGGGNGGGGGGAILISSSRDITINGGIYANGGQPYSYAAYGSGGGIRLVADRISGGGILQANGGGAGRIRLEGYYRSLVGNTSPVSSVSAPVATRNFDSLGALIISKVAGQVVAQPPHGDSNSPDVLFTSAGDVTIDVKGQGIPDNTPVTLRVTTANGVIIKPGQGDPAINLVGGAASFTITVPAGLGTIQAFAQFTQQ